MTATAAAPTAHATPTARAKRNPQRDFLDLSRRVKAAGLMDRRPGWYLARAVLLAAGFAGATALMLMLGTSPWQLAVAALFGILLTQTAFFGHDAAHQQVFSDSGRNELLSQLIANFVVGLSHGWWAGKHGRHHANPNVIGKDGDIATGALVFNPDDAHERTGIVGWITRRQGWFFFPMLTLEGLNLHVAAIRTIIADKEMHRRWLEVTLLTIRLIGFPALIVVAMGPALGAMFLAVQLVVFGVYMGATFAPNHKGMPLLPKESRVDFLRRQVMTSRNIRGGRFITWGMGGLNYQIEHHLFPRMPSANLRQTREIVREFCAERNVPYTETGLVEAYGIVVRYLNRVGLGESDPFECPIVAAYRPR